jgi:hypothetical protein
VLIKFNLCRAHRRDVMQSVTILCKGREINTAELRLGDGGSCGVVLVPSEVSLCFVA